nr:hypothetical protein [uncultured Acetatifactor sp.]
MDKETIVFIVEDAIHASDGYKSRIEMEMDILCDKFSFVMIAPKNKRNLSFRHNVEVIEYYGFCKKIPFLFNAGFIKKKVRKVKALYNNPIIYCEALPAAVAIANLCKKLKLRFVFDCHGTAPDEVHLYHPNWMGLFYSRWLRKKQHAIVRDCALLVTVSKKQYELFATDKQYVLLPMLPAAQFYGFKNYRKQMRQKLGIPQESTVYVYSGQNQKWQMTDRTLQYYRIIEDANPLSFLVILTSCIDELKCMVKRLHIKNYAVLKSDYEDVPKYLDACDYGFCLRENHIINRVAAPTKVLEYVVRNVTPILSDYVGDYSEELRKEQLTAIIDIHKFSAHEQMTISTGDKYVENLRNKYIQKYLEAMERL